MISVFVLVALLAILVVAAVAAYLSIKAYTAKEKVEKSWDPEGNEVEKVLQETDFTKPKQDYTVRAIVGRKIIAFFGDSPMKVIVVTAALFGILSYVLLTGPGRMAFEAKLSYIGAFMTAPIVTPFQTTVIAIAVAVLVHLYIKNALSGKILVIGKNFAVLKDNPTLAPYNAGLVYEITRIAGSIPASYLMRNDAIEAPRHGTEKRWGKKATLLIPDGYDKFLKSITLPLIKIKVLYGPVRIAYTRGSSFCDFVLMLDASLLDRQTAVKVVDEIEHKQRQLERMHSKFNDLMRELQILSHDAEEALQWKLRPILRNLSEINRAMVFHQEVLAEMIKTMRSVFERMEMRTREEEE